MIKTDSIKESITNFQGVLYHYTDYLFCYPWWKSFYAVLDVDKQTFAIYKSKDMSQLYVCISVSTINEILMPSPDEFVIFYRFEYYRFKGQNQVDTEMWYDALKVLISALSKKYVQLLNDLKKNPLTVKGNDTSDIVKKPLPKPSSKKSALIKKTKGDSKDASSERNIAPLDDPYYSSAIPKSPNEISINPKKNDQMSIKAGKSGPNSQENTSINQKTRYSELNKTIEVTGSTDSNKTNTNTGAPLYDGYVTNVNRPGSGQRTVDGIQLKPANAMTTNLYASNQPTAPPPAGTGTHIFPERPRPRPKIHETTDSMNNLISNFNKLYSNKPNAPGTTTTTTTTTATPSRPGQSRPAHSRPAPSPAPTKTNTIGKAPANVVFYPDESEIDKV